MFFHFETIIYVIEPLLRLPAITTDVSGVQLHDFLWRQLSAFEGLFSANRTGRAF